MNLKTFKYEPLGVEVRAPPNRSTSPFEAAASRGQRLHADQMLSETAGKANGHHHTGARSAYARITARAQQRA